MKASRSSKKRGSGVPIVAARKSGRLPQHPTIFSQASDNISSGMNVILGNSFSILNSMDDEFMEDFVVNCDIHLGGSEEEVLESLSAIKLEVMARAAIAEATYIKKQE